MRDSKCRNKSVAIISRGFASIAIGARPGHLVKLTSKVTLFILLNKRANPLGLKLLEL